VGILTWEQTQCFPSMPKDRRQDAELVVFFRDAGVPAQQLVYLQDAEATSVSLPNQLSALLARLPPGNTLFCYFAGHGLYDPRSDTFYLAPYDARDAGVDADADVSPSRYTQCWPMAQILTALAEDFRGCQCVVLADCCFSGGLARLSACMSPWRFPLVCLCSTWELSPSTWTWAFTRCFLDVLAGYAHCDGNDDGVVDLDDAMTYLACQMAFFEEQKATFFLSSACDRHWRLTIAHNSVTTNGDGDRGGNGDEDKDSEAIEARLAIPDAGLGQRVECRWGGGWWRGQVLRRGVYPYASGGVSEWALLRWVAHEQGWPNQWVDLSLCPLRPYRPMHFPEGTLVQILDMGRWWDGRCVRFWYGLHLVDCPNRFPQTKRSEPMCLWVGPSRIRPVE
jgi:hypothetical protein